MITLGIIVVIIISIVTVPLDSVMFWNSSSVEDFSARHLPLAEGVRAATAEGGDVVPSRFQISKERLLPPVLAGRSEFSTPLSANAAIVVDVASNEILYSKGIDQQRSIASVSKLMSAMVLLDTAPDWNAAVTIAPDDMRLGREYVSEGEKVRVQDLFYASVVGSSNTATIALAKSTGLDMQEFVARMNQKAKVMGLVQTQFVEPTGLDSQNKSSAREIAVVLRYAMRYPEIAKAAARQSYGFAPTNTGVSRKVGNTNWLLTNQVVRLSDADVVGGKTGFIEESGYNLATHMEQGGHTIAVVVLGADEHFARFTEVDMLSAWVFDNFVWSDQEGYGNN